MLLYPAKNLSSFKFQFIKTVAKMLHCTSIKQTNQNNDYFSDFVQHGVLPLAVLYLHFGFDVKFPEDRRVTASDQYQRKGIP